MAHHHRIETTPTHHHTAPDRLGVADQRGLEALGVDGRSGLAEITA